MLRTTKFISIFFVLTLITVFAATPLVADDGPKLVGTWLVYLDDQPDVPPLLFTFNGDGTLIGSTVEKSGSNAHGVWEKAGPRAFNATQISYIFGEGEIAELINKTNARYQVSQDGQSVLIEAAVEIMLPDGTVIFSSSGTATGTRLNVEPF